MPVLEIYMQLQKRGLSLGIPEYLAVLDALHKGFGQSRESLLQTCQLIWAKSSEQRQIIEEVFEVVLPSPLAKEDIAKIIEEINQHQDEPESRNTQTEVSEEPSLPKSPISDEQDKSSKQVQSGVNLRTGFGQSDVNILEPGSIMLPIKANYDFKPKPPVSVRQIAKTLRYFREMKRQGSKTEFDVVATIENIYKKGLFIEPVMVPARKNTARLAVLIDQKGSMKPFDLLIDAFEQGLRASGLQQVKVFYFHDVPVEYIFQDRNLSKGIDLATVWQRLNNHSLLIISDGGATKGSSVKNRIVATMTFINQTTKFLDHIAWLNPVPSERWQNTSAEAIVRHPFITMHHFDKDGLFHAVKSLQGVMV